MESQYKYVLLLAIGIIYMIFYWLWYIDYKHLHISVGKANKYYSEVSFHITVAILKQRILSAGKGYRETGILYILIRMQN